MRCEFNTRSRSSKQGLKGVLPVRQELRGDDHAMKCVILKESEENQKAERAKASLRSN